MIRQMEAFKNRIRKENIHIERFTYSSLNKFLQIRMYEKELHECIQGHLISACGVMDNSQHTCTRYPVNKCLSGFVAQNTVITAF